MGRITTALISCAEKSGLGEFARRLAEAGASILATGGTASYLRDQGVEVIDIAHLTGKVEHLGGLVKTLHPAIHAGILADRDNAAHMEELASSKWRKIDMVVVNFYPLKRDEGHRDLSFIDIGGPTMARAAAKNFASCVPVPDPSWYERVAEEIEAGGDVTKDLRWELATCTIGMTRAYDDGILSIAAPDRSLRAGDASLALQLRKATDLKYGENPHQEAAFYTEDGETGLEVLKGELSYNNMLDVDCCFGQLGEFDGTAAVVVKHVGPCGVAEAEDPLAALENAYACDPLSAFGGVIGVNFPFTEECAGFLAKRFVECIAAPAFDEAALVRLRKKKRIRLVAAGRVTRQTAILRTVLGGMLAQSPDDKLLAGDLKFVTGEPPEQAVIEDLLFAWKTVKHVKSNAIVFAAGKRTIGIGAGQPSRVDATKIAIRKAGEHGHKLAGSVMASDGFFPFPDSIELAHEAGARAVIQPGGSIRDGEVIAAAKAMGIVMVLTGTRHFRH